MRKAWLIIGGVAALVGGFAWTVKGLVILAGGDQPPFLFEVAPALFGIGLLSMAHTALPPSRRRTVVMGFAGIAIIADVVAVVTEVVGDVAGAAIATSSLALVVGLVTLDRRSGWPISLAWWIGVAMLPAVFVGGMLSEIDERLLEVPLVVLGVAWIVVGWAALRTPIDSGAYCARGAREVISQGSSGGPSMNTKTSSERAIGLMFLLLLVFILVSTMISGYDTSRDGWADELTRLGKMSDTQITVNLLFQTLAAVGLMVVAVMFYLSLASRSRNLATLAAAFMFCAGITTLAASASYRVVADLADVHLNGDAGDGVLTTSRAFALAMDAFVSFTALTLSIGVYMLAIVGHRERLVPRWMIGLAVASMVLLGLAFGIDLASDSEVSWAFLMGGLLCMLAWVLTAGLALIGSRGKRHA